MVETKSFAFLDQGAELRTHERPNPGGVAPLATETTIAADGASRTVSEPDGTDVAIVAGPDPRFGFQAPVIESLTIDTPGHSYERTQQRTADIHPVTGALLGLTDTISVNGKPPAIVDFDAASSTILTSSPEGREVERTIDALGRTTNIAIGPPPGSGGFHPIVLGYDSAGRLDFVSQGTGGSQRLTDFQYDSDGNLEFVIDPLHTTQLAYDDANRVDLLTRPDLQSVGFGYDANGNLDELTPPGRPTHGFAFTRVNQESLYTPPAVAGAGSTTTHWDLDRRPDDVVRPDGTILDFTYDAAGRLDALTVPGRGVVDYTYSTTTGHLDTILTPEGSSLALGYDGFLPETQTWSGPVSGTVSRDHDDELLVASETVMGSTVSFDYDDDNLPVSAGAMILIPDADHGLLRTTELGSVTTSQDYSAFGELSIFEAAHASSLLYREEILLRDKLGRIEDRRETIGGVATDYHYAYDAAGRLEQVFVNSVLQTTYGYHPNGARTSKTQGSVTNGTYDAQDRIETWGTLAFTHTPNGERLTRTDTATSQTTTYTTDALGNLMQVVLPGGPTIDYVIDGLNRRIGKKVGATLVQGFLYRDALEPVAELDGTGALVSRFVYASKPHVPDYMVKGGATYRIISDHLGSVRLVVNVATGVVEQRIDYDEFGNPTFVIGSPDFQPFGFAGGLYDPHTKLVRFGARDYDPETGRWTAKDPIGFGGGDANLYGYVINDPVNLLDVDGRAFNLAIGAFGALAGGVANGALVAAQGGSFGRGFVVGAVAGFAAGFSLNPLAAGAAIGALNTAGNIAAGNVQSTRPAADIAIGAGLGCVGSAAGAVLGASAAPSTAAASGFADVGSAAGATAASALAQAAQSLSNFFGGL